MFFFATISFLVASVVVASDSESPEPSKTVHTPTTIETPQYSNGLWLYVPSTTSIVDDPGSSQRWHQSDDNTGVVWAGCIVGLILGVAVIGVFVTCAMRGYRAKKRGEIRDLEAARHGGRGPYDVSELDIVEADAFRPVKGYTLMK